MELNISYEDSGGVSVARYEHTTPHPLWPHLTSGVWATLSRYLGSKPTKWLADMYLELPDERRTPWSVTNLFETQDEAAIRDRGVAADSRGAVRAWRGRRRGDHARAAPGAGCGSRVNA